MPMPILLERRRHWKLITLVEGHVIWELILQRRWKIIVMTMKLWERNRIKGFYGNIKED